MRRLTDENIYPPRWVGDAAMLPTTTNLDFFRTLSAPSDGILLAGLAVWTDIATGIVKTGVNPSYLSAEYVMVEGIAITEPNDNKQVTYQIGDAVGILIDGFAGVEIPYAVISEATELYVHEKTGVFSGLGGPEFLKVGNVYIVPSLCRSDFQVVNISSNLRKDFL